ncbi:TlpA disulfide reductase family protein [Aquimarina muelleri]|uniref:Thiol:disulfide interchange protein n=1 Tax=Aquimarina muelleri TaxID=279356 RepID=A0A918JWJ4_9FLAO|nr:TlpA disulfide reductase family protein [Aquimarina muelleri]MCX2764648.1 AhpC/TSA family protein [Aquimarina muelleri]GGX25381.1 thiol:disulfide interchange protein [Aquimarina muelleri]
MKRIALLATTLLLVACQKDQKGYSITADAAGFEDGTVVYINAISQSSRPIIIDSTTIQNEKFEVALPAPESNDFNYLTFKDIRGNVLFLAENNPIKMTIYKDSMRSSVITGGAENKLFHTYVNTLNKYNEEKTKLSNQHHVSSKLGEAEKALQISSKREELVKKEDQFRKDMAENNSGSLISIMALTDLLNLKKLTPQEAKTKFGTLNDSLKTTRLGKNLEQLINSAITMASQKRIDIGSTAEDFSAPTPNGKILSLKESMGKVTIIDFWASWCKPCRIENPNVVKVYNKYHKKGLNIIGVSLDKKQDAWTKAIADDNLEWNHVSNLQFWQEPIARAYGVRSIPATFILDEKGNIIAKNLRGPALEQKIAELLEQKSL